MKRLLILGAGTGGTIIANKMRKVLKDDWNITIIDKSKLHYYQPGQIFIPFKLYGYNSEDGCVKPSGQYIPDGVNFVNDEITAVNPNEHRVTTKGGSYEYDWLVIALGCRIAPEEIPGMEEGYGKNVFYFYTMKSALDMQKALEQFDGGKLVLNIAEYPIKCPVAPIEYVCLADYYFTQRGIRDKVEISVVTGMQGVFTKPIAGDMMGSMLGERGIKVIPNFNLAEVDSSKGVIKSYDGQEVQFDFLAAIPPNLGAKVFDGHDMADGNCYILTDPKTLKSAKYDNVFVLGDSTNVTTSKAGSVAHFEAEIVYENLLAEIEGKEPHPDFDGHSNCFIETGYNKAHLIDFNYTQQPVPGKLPYPLVGPFSLLKETRMNHWGKMFFRWYYWNMLLKDRFSKSMELFLPTRMSYRGKDKHYLEK